MKRVYKPGTVYNLSNGNLVAQGDHRACYRHPEDPTKCLKILHEDWRQINRRLNDPLKYFRSRTHFHENRIEAKELAKIVRKCGPRMRQHFPQSYGFCETDLGSALITDFIQDSDGTPAHTLKSYIWKHGYTDKARKAIEAFWSFLLSEAIIVRDPDPYNICLAQLADGNLQAYLVDGYGRSDFLPFVELVPYLTRKKLAKRKARFDRQLREHLKDIENGRPLKGKGAVDR